MSARAARGPLAAVPGRRAAVRRLVPPVLGATVLALLVLHLGARPFLDAFRLLDPPALLGAAALAAAATLAAAWRWSVLAAALGDPLPLRVAVREYARSQLLNLLLPGGVLGDVHRAVAPRSSTTDRSTRMRAVVWDRGTGQLVQAVLVAAVLLLAAPALWPVVAAAPVLLLALLALLRRRAATPPRRGAGRAAATVRADVAALRRRPGVLAAVVVASVGVTLSHAATFVLAALVTGTRADAVPLLLVALVAQAATAVPISIGGWGAREGAAAAVFGAAGLGAAHGVTAALAAGALTLLGALPGLLPLLLPPAARRRPAASRSAA